MDHLRTLPLLFRAQLRALVVSKRALVCLLLALGPVAAAVLVRYVSAAEGEPVPAFEIGWVLIIQGTVPLLALILGSAVVAEEIEDRTISYLFARPVPRAAVLLGRWLATALVTEALLLLCAAATFAILERGAGADPQSALPPGMSAALLRTCLLGGLVYSALFSAAGTFLKHPMIVGIGYTFVVEGFIANLPGQNPTLTIQFHLKSHLAGAGPGFAERMRELSSHQDLLPPDEALRTLWIVLAVALAVGCLAISRRQYVLTA
jgi:ABC-2 type transport system permease protein